MYVFLRATTKEFLSRDNDKRINDLHYTEQPYKTQKLKQWHISLLYNLFENKQVNEIFDSDSCKNM